MTRWPIGLLIVAMVACVPTASTSPAVPGTIEIEVVAGPVCPVEREPPDPACDPGPVDGARILIQPGDGRDIVVGEATSDASGRATVEIAPGDYIVLGIDVEGLMGRPEPATVTVSPGQAVMVTLTYDTGIR